MRIVAWLGRYGHKSQVPRPTARSPGGCDLLGRVGGEPVGTAATTPESGLNGLLLSVAPGILGSLVADLRGRDVEPAVVAGCSLARPGASACGGCHPPR